MLNFFSVGSIIYAIVITIAVVWLPGYCIVRTLFPRSSDKQQTEQSRNLTDFPDTAERFLLSVVFSLSLASMIVLGIYRIPPVATHTTTWNVGVGFIGLNITTGLMLLIASVRQSRPQH